MPRPVEQHSRAGLVIDRRIGDIVPVPARRSIVALAIVAGAIVLQRAFPHAPPSAWFSVASMACASALIVRGRSCKCSMAVALGAIAAGWTGARVEYAGGALAPTILHAERPPWQAMLVEVEGIAIESPRPVRPAGALAHFQRREPREHFPLALARVRVRTSDGDAWVGATGRLRVFVPAGTRVRAGDRLRILARHTPPARRMNPGEPDRRALARQARDAGSLGVPDASLIETLEPESVAQRTWSGMLRFADALRSRARRALAVDSSGESHPLVAAVVLGVHDPAHQDLRDRFARQGLAHLMAISGFHLALLVGLVLVALRLVGDPGRIEAFVLLALLGLYLVLVPARPPIQRAALILAAMILAEGAGRRYDRLTLLGWIAIALLALRPLDLFSLGYQLSVGLTGALLWIAPSLRRRLFPPPIRGLIHRPRPAWREGLGWIATRLQSAFVVSLVCWLIALPVIIWHTGRISPGAILSTLIVTPMIVLVLAAGFSAVLVALVVPPLATVPASLSTMAAEETDALVRTIDAVEGSTLRIGSVSAVWAIAATLTLALCLRRGFGLRGFLATLALALWLMGERAFERARDAGDLVLSTLSVGDGTCHLLQQGSRAMLIDCGSSRPSFGVRALPDALRALGSPRVPRVLLTHPNLDHYNALLDAIEPLGVREVLLGQAFRDEARRRPDGPEAFVLREIVRRGVRTTTLEAGDSITLGQATIEVLWPIAEETPPTLNDASIVTRITHGGRTILTTGDIQSFALAALSRMGLHGDAIELPHHGSHSRQSESFLVRTNPAIVVQSSGPSRLGDERWARVRPGRVWFVTAQDGFVQVRITRDGCIDGRAPLSDDAGGPASR